MKTILLVLFLAGCASQEAREDTANLQRQAQMEQFAQEINTQRDAKTIGYSEGQKRKWTLHRQLWPQDPYMGEFYTYTIMLGEKVDKGELAPSEYMYLATRKQTEVTDRINADDSRRTRDAAAVLQAMPQPVYQPIHIEPYRRPAQTNCHSDSMGNTRCTTY